MRVTAAIFAALGFRCSIFWIRAVKRSGLMIQTEPPKSSISVSVEMLLLPDPFGPATIQNFGLSSFLRDTVGRTEFFLVRAPGLGDIPLEDNAQVVSERWTICVDRKNSDSLSARFVNAFRYDRAPGM